MSKKGTINLEDIPIVPDDEVPEGQIWLERTDRGKTERIVLSSKLLEEGLKLRTKKRKYKDSK